MMAVYITRPIPTAALSRLDAARLPYTMYPGPAGQVADALAHAGKGFEAVISQLTDPIDERVVRAWAGSCRIIATCAAGYDNIDLAAADRAGILVTHTPAVLTDATADLTWALLLAAARRLGQAERDLRAGRWSGWNILEYWGSEVCGSTLAIVGAGRIGCAVARRAAGFQMNLCYASRRDSPELNAAGARRMTLDESLAASDFVSLHLPLTAQTRGLIDARALSLMRPGAVLVNTARGGLVDHAALAEALREGRLAAAGLDVYPDEPNVPPELLALDNVVLLPHIGSATRQTRERMAIMAVDEVIALSRGEAPRHAVARGASD